MKNISKTTKTILFASLIAAMILPFSGMTNAVAETQTDEVLQRIQEAKENAQNKGFAISGEESKENKKLLYRLNLAEKHRILQLNGEGDSKEANKIMSKLHAHFAEYFEDSPPQELGNSKMGMMAKAFGVSRTYDTSDIERTDCNQTNVGDSHGTITAWATSSYLQGSLVSGSDYPSSTTVNCSSKNFDGGYIFYYNFYTPWTSCIQDFDSSTYIRGDWCAGISTNDLILVEAQSWYQGNIWSLYFSNQWVAL